MPTPTWRSLAHFGVAIGLGGSMSLSIAAPITGYAGSGGSSSEQLGRGMTAAYLTMMIVVPAGMSISAWFAHRPVTMASWPPRMSPLGQGIVLLAAGFLLLISAACWVLILGALIQYASPPLHPTF